MICLWPISISGGGDETTASTAGAAAADTTTAAITAAEDTTAAAEEGETATEGERPPDFWYTNMSAEADPDEVYLNGERAKVAEMGVVPLPTMTYTEEENSNMAAYKTDIDSYIQQYVAQVATGELDLEESWDTYIETMNAMGAQELAGIYQTAYERALAQ